MLIRHIRRWIYWIGPVRLLGAVAVAIGAVLGAIWLTHPTALGPSFDPEVAVWPPGTVSAAEPFELVSLAGAPPSSPATVVVHVAGAVVSPGVRRLPGDARVIDAVAAAGGTTPEADLDAVNLAAPVVDGQQIYLPRIGEIAVVPTGGAPAAGPVDLNAADLETLDRLPGIGPTTAAAIIEYRERFGRFNSVDELLGVRGIGPAKLDTLRDLVAV